MARITVTADASFCPRTNAGGWGYWIASDRGKLGGGGPLRKVACSQAAKMMAIVNALDVGVRSGLIRNGDFVLVQTDCQSAIFCFERRQGNTTEQQNVIRAYLNISETANFGVSFRHVKGHTKRNANPEARYGANRACDARARYHMERARARLENADGPVP